MLLKRFGHLHPTRLLHPSLLGNWLQLGLLKVGNVQSREATFPRFLLRSLTAFAVGVGKSFAVVSDIARDAWSQLRTRTSTLDARPHRTRSISQNGRPQCNGISGRFKTGTLRTYPLGSHGMCTKS